METSTVIWIIVAVVVVVIVIALVAGMRRKQAGRPERDPGHGDGPRLGATSGTTMAGAGAAGAPATAHQSQREESRRDDHPADYPGATADRGDEPAQQEGFGRNEYSEGHHDPRFTERGDADLNRDGRVDAGYEERGGDGGSPGGAGTAAPGAAATTADESHFHDGAPPADPGRPDGDDRSTPPRT